MGSISLRGLKRLDKNMALLLVTLAALVACSTADMHSMQNNMMMQGMMPQQQGMMMVQAGNGGCSESESSEEGGCEIPMGNTIENVEEYLDQQMQQQQYATQQMAEKVKAQFQAMVQVAMMKKYRYVMSLVTEYISFCQCADVSTQMNGMLQMGNQMMGNQMQQQGMNAGNWWGMTPQHDRLHPGLGRQPP